MANGVEVVLAFERKDADAILAALGLTYSANDYELVGPVEALDRKLMQAHKAACKRMGWKPVPKFVSVYITPLGERSLNYFNLEVFAEGEWDETWDDDWENVHGTLYPVLLDKLRPMMEIAKEEIVKVLPIFATAQWQVRERHY